MDLSLPPQLAERMRYAVHPSHTSHGPGEFVLYWMHNALRAHQNPALDVAICLARQNGLPLLVYHGLSEDYPFASDRFHCFMLQGHRDVQRELTDRGINSFFHLERNGHRGPHLRDLTRQAAILVTEEMPVQPLAGWVERLISHTTTPIALVDASCVIPMPMLGRCFTRAYEFRNATREIFNARVGTCYEEQPVDCVMYEDAVPFEPCDLQNVSLAELIADCQVDHSISPVADTPGGSRAGYRRWEEFRRHGLEEYAARRTDVVMRGVSRMSAYLHFGMVSPFRIAGDAKQKNAKKFLEQLVTWRELAFHFCYHNIEQIDSMDAIPEWARRTLAENQCEHRPHNYSWETLARAKSGSDFWNLCQRSLIKHGELHNDLRMSWGKAILPWANTPGRAMRLTMDLNHRFALDGRDPCSYAGVLWCFGQFDRPASHENPFYGAVRTRSVGEQQRRIDAPKVRELIDRPVSAKSPRVAVIGAGLAGLVAARTLVDHGLSVQVFEKSRGLGGRLATRRVHSLGGLAFDHGAQYFTARDRRFCRYVTSWIHDGLVQPWNGRIVELAGGGRVRQEKRNITRFVGVPSMNAIAEHLGADLNVELQTRIVRLDQTFSEAWNLVAEDKTTHGPFEIVIVNCPPAQTHELIGEHADFAADVAATKMSPTWAVMMLAEGLKDLPYGAAFINDGPLSWIARNSAKPGRYPATCKLHADADAWVLHASSGWTSAHLQVCPEEVVTQLVAAFGVATGTEPKKIHHAEAHKWLYATPENGLSKDYLFDTTAGLVACGDWCGGPRVEGAFLSGMAAAGGVLRQLTIDRPAPHFPQGVPAQELALR